MGIVGAPPPADCDAAPHGTAADSPTDTAVRQAKTRIIRFAEALIRSSPPYFN